MPFKLEGLRTSSTEYYNAFHLDTDKHNGSSLLHSEHLNLGTGLLARQVRRRCSVLYRTLIPHSWAVAPFRKNGKSGFDGGRTLLFVASKVRDRIIKIDQVESRREDERLVIRLKELYFGSKFSGSGTLFSLVFHTEGLVNDKVVRALVDFGKNLKGSFRPLLAVITPECPQYAIDPFIDPLRTRFGLMDPPQTFTAKFEATIKNLSSYYDIGYHGHFFKLERNYYRPAFDHETISTQFREEVEYLSGIGFPPRTYAGGWWHISRDLVRLLQSSGFTVDTTVNDTGRDSFSRKQEITISRLGEPFWLGKGLLEVPSARSVFSLLATMTRNRRRNNFVVLAIHDYDLSLDSTSSSVSSTIDKLRKAERIVSIDSLVAESKKWLGSAEGEKAQGRAR